MAHATSTQQIIQPSLDRLLTRYGVLHYSIKMHKDAANEAIDSIQAETGSYDWGGKRGNVDHSIEVLKDADFNLEVEEGSKADIEIQLLRGRAVFAIGGPLPAEIENMIQGCLLCDWEKWRKRIEEKLKEAESYRRFLDSSPASLLEGRRSQELLW